MADESDTEKELLDEIRRSGDLEAALRFVGRLLEIDGYPRSKISDYIKETLARVGL